MSAGRAAVVRLLAAAAVTLAASAVDAGVPSPGAHRAPFDPTRCGVGVSGQGSPCQFRFHPDGSADELTVSITLRDPFDVPVPDCSTSVTLVPVGLETYNFCTCCGEKQTGFTDATGILQVSWDRIGGFGSLEARVTAHCVGNIAIAHEPLDYTSSDLTGNCTTSNGPDVDVFDVALWVRSLPPDYWIRADWDCSGAPIEIMDLGAWAGGFGKNCDAGEPCP